MTGFGEGKSSSARLEVRATLRSVNHRFLDLALRMPEDLRGLEPLLTQKLRGLLKRGRVELRLTVGEVGEREIEVRVDEKLAASYAEAASLLARRHGVSKELTCGELLRLPEVIAVDAGVGAIGEDEASAVGRAVDQALEGLIAARSREGGELAGALRRILGELAKLVSGLDRSREQLQAALHEKTRGRLAELTQDVGLGEDRLAQEIAILVDRADVREEIDRLQVHLERFESLLEAKQAVGKRLDFLAQEILRELNTIGSKCRNSEAIELVLEGKVRCEQLREQVQNVE